MEARRGIAAREMLRTGDLVVPRLGDRVYLAKPPLFYWAVAAVSAPGGEVTAFTLRAASGLSAMALLLLVYLYVRKTLDRTTALTACVALATMAVVFHQATLGQVNMLLTLAVTASLFSAHALLGAPRRAIGPALLCGVALAAGLLTKGPVNLLFFLPAVGAVLLVPGGARRLLRREWWIVLATTLVLVLPWVLLLLDSVGVDRAWASIRHEVIRARFSRVGKSNVEPLWFYLWNFPVGIAPLGLFSIVAFFPGARREDEPARGLLLLLRGDLAGSLLLFTVISSAKSGRYMLPAAPAAAVLAADVLVRGVRGRLAPALTRIVGGAARIAPWLLLPAGPVALAVWLAAGFPVGVAVVAATAAALAGAGVAILLRRRVGPAATLAGLLLLMAGAKLLVDFGHAEVVNHARSPRQVCEGIRSRVPRDARLYYAGRIDDGLLFHLDVPPLSRRAPGRAFVCYRPKRKTGGLPFTSQGEVVERGRFSYGDEELMLAELLP